MRDGDKPGYAKMPHWLFDPRSRTASDPLMRQVYMHLVMKANWKDGISPVRQGVVLRRGQLVTSPETLANELGMPKKKKSIERRLFRLAADQRIDQQRDHAGTLITIVNYDCCDESEKDVSNGLSNQRPAVCPTGVQPLSTSEEELRKEEAKNITPPRAGAHARNDPPLTPSQILQRALGAQWLEADDARYSDLAEAAARDEVGAYATAVVLKRYKSLHSFWSSYRSRICTTPAGMVEKQYREIFEAILLDPGFNVDAVLARRRIAPPPEETGDHAGDLISEAGDFGTMEGWHGGEWERDGGDGR